MANLANRHPRLNFTPVELAHSIQVQSRLPPSCHSALRAGFAGYTDNPRWTPQKRRAWKQGKQWRSELAGGLIEVRDGFLMTKEALAQSAEAAAADDSANPSAKSSSIAPDSKTKLFQNLLGWSRKNPAIN